MIAEFRSGHLWKLLLTSIVFSYFGNGMRLQPMNAMGSRPTFSCLCCSTSIGLTFAARCAGIGQRASLMLAW